MNWPDDTNVETSRYTVDVDSANDMDSVTKESEKGEWENQNEVFSCILFSWLQPSCCATSQTVHSRQSSLPGRRCPTLEQLGGGRHRSCWFPVDLTAQTERLSVPADTQMLYC